MKDLIKFSIPGNPDYVKMVRIAIASLAGNAGFDMEKIEDIKVSVSEACKNVTCHGHDGFSTGYAVTCEIDKKEMVITITDELGTYDIVKEKKPCMDCPKEGDLAMFVIESLMDEAELTRDANGNKSIRMVKCIC